MWGGQTTSSAMSPGSTPDALNTTSNTSPRASVPATGNVSVYERRDVDPTVDSLSVLNKEQEDTIYDPEQATAGPTHRPSTLFQF
jgi:hypothetical protein